MENLFPSRRFSQIIALIFSEAVEVPAFEMGNNPGKTEHRSSLIWHTGGTLRAKNLQ